MYVFYSHGIHDSCQWGKAEMFRFQRKKKEKRMKSTAIILTASLSVLGFLATFTGCNGSPEKQTETASNDQDQTKWSFPSKDEIRGYAEQLCKQFNSGNAAGIADEIEYSVRFEDEGIDTSRMSATDIENTHDLIRNIEKKYLDEKFGECRQCELMDTEGEGEGRCIRLVTDQVLREHQYNTKIDPIVVTFLLVKDGEGNIAIRNYELGLYSDLLNRDRMHDSEEKNTIKNPPIEIGGRYFSRETCVAAMSHTCV